MSNPLKKIGKALKSVAKGVKKVFSSGLGKAILIGAGLFFALPLAATALGVGAGAAGGAAAGAGAGAWWSSTLGVGAAGAGAGAGVGAAAAGGAVSPGIMAGLGMPGAATGQMAAMSAAKPAFMQAAAAAGSGAVNWGPSALNAGAAGPGTTAAGNLSTGEVIKNATTSAVKQEVPKEATKGLLGRAMDGFNNMSPLGQGALVNVAGQGIAGMAKSRAEQKALEEQYRREDEERNRQSIFGVRYDGSRPLPDYNAGQMMQQAVNGYSRPSFSTAFQTAPQRESRGLLDYNPYIYGSA